MGQAKLGDTVKVHYTGKLDDGTVFDTSVEREPLQFSIGEGLVIPGFEQAVVGMTPGESKRTNIPADEAYGPYRPELVMVVDKERIPTDVSIEVGQMLQISQSNGQAIPVVVTEVSDSQITLDANHPLAGQELIFDIQLIQIN
ncbi:MULTISPECIES: FKBP-type peptidyl-prolyl cis-trans isomerase [Fischerella]|jgi:FKBP-type peptidyl-prolyl cis-trans isomerase 2|uniref:Peptidyl-prolyl cis-trans isomerase n=3 Tax=Fischerella TaxID=1190 RepID=G6FRS3_9CYAN|nr:MULTISPECIES: peptidylprolyl isomerase [Fischerella]PLZ78499.1 peptidylprolyl isomerase [Fischerella thermalis WC217]PLZ88826.1 peptidylprolyl isomerase [Fischerella thermalis CCMEE 5196]PMB10128.1 peptidylprolyl isomerase [Fischerella thermalis CCMEE 5273]PMB12511.1 peptidylprolyl isomerase [Fischerella thermalis CCMEE 5328]BCX10237.1 MAG: peptidyl-prolyl cis-trans isomerase [Fischerella sp.]